MRVGVIGAGVMGSNHIRVLEQSKTVDEVLVFDEYKQYDKLSQRVFQVDSLSDLLESAIDYAVIATPTSKHVDIGLQLAKNQIPTLIEKPVASSVNDAEVLLEAFNSNSTMSWVGFVERFNPAAQAMRARLTEGLIGDVLQISTRRVGPYPSRISDVGVLLDLASHDIDLTRWLTGQDYESCSSRLMSVLDSPHEDAFLGLGTLESSVTVAHEVNWLTPRKTRSISILGTTGMLVADLLNAEVRLYKNGHESSDWELYRQLRGVSEGEMIQFVVAVREPLILEHEAIQSELLTGESSDLCPLHEGVSNLKIVERFMH
jgi:UDP-N-acetylglucosamine 3-dehydrogenase